VATRKVRKKKARSKQFKAIVPPKAGSAKIGVPFQNRHEVTKNDQLFVPGSRGINAAIFLFLIIGTVALYSSDLRLGFFRVDDQQYVVHNPWIKEVNADNIKHILTTQYFVNYSPLHLFSYMLDYAIGGSDPYTFHLSSNLWAGIVAGFVFLVALAFTKRHLIAILAAILFIVHPAHVEAIAWISSRKDLVATAFVLPSLLAYLKYRKTLSLRWYILSIVLFVFALAGKLSVATFPAVFVAIDLFMEKRTLLRSLVDKWPYMIAVVIMALIVASAQPPTGSHPDPYILAAALLQNAWLSTGFGTYVIYRPAPVSQNLFLEIGAVVLLLFSFIAPLWVKRRFPLATVLIYWMLFVFLPTQVLSFAYPVTDRYLFLPSVALVILISASLIIIGESLLKKSLSAIAVLILIAILWSRNTIQYLHEWNDPRSVWYGASKKSSDPLVYYNLGWNYMDKAAAMGDRPRKPPIPNDEAVKFASAVWENDQRLQPLLSEWSKGVHSGPLERSLQAYLRTLANSAYDKALAVKGTHIMPDFFFHRGMLSLDENNFTDAKMEFMHGINEASQSSFTEGSREVLVNCYYNLAILEWTQQNFVEALKWIKMAEEEQTKSGGNWFPDVNANRRKLEQIIQSLHLQ
jgi:hypothetical protein